MFWAIIILSALFIGSITGGIALLKKQHRKITSLEIDLVEEQEKLRQEILRSQEIEKQVSDLLEFNSNDAEIEKEMDDHVRILRKAGSNDNVKEELKKVSTTIRNIYKSN